MIREQCKAKSIELNIIVEKAQFKEYKGYVCIIFNVNSFLKQFSFKESGADSNQDQIVENDQFIMIVDDDPFNHDKLVMIFMRIGYIQFHQCL
ncbi:unnamed protein product (macronuclear) [Paramecium tetraurelia]|uniref:Response regulatory domain-containing protein n=1 Tax=Paramecium tetraurelia TaxID=5888 RepID=A0C3X8_PARTE|nr:uncharacterized protein GSPATT00034974001 [Paramecium tetraurelia]CAK65495.1 unnamed protein product [Paramecium tetraurelia]|eukprot:XP_001432892.1 hypothetical protein (macronuclear) [Paramecium tetraurelia strain d4-2]